MLSQRDHGDLRAPGFPHLAVRPEEIRAAGGAQRTTVDPFRAETCPQQPLPVEAREVHVPFGALPGQIRGGLGAQRLRHSSGNVAVGFKAALLDAGTHGGHQVLRPGAEGGGHGLDGLFRDAGGTAPPAGVYGSDGPVNGIVEQQDPAVGGKDRQREVCIPGNERVRRVIPGRQKSLSGIRLSTQTDCGLMDLLAQDCAGRIDTQSAAEAAVVFPDGGGVVVPGRGPDSTYQRAAGSHRPAGWKTHGTPRPTGKR